MKKNISERFVQKIERIFIEGESNREILEDLGTLLRKYDSIKNRMEGYTKYLREKIRLLMEKMEITEYRFRRTFIRIDEVWTIPSDEEGKKIVEKLGEAIGKENVRKWVEVEEEIIPARTRVSYHIPPTVRKEIENAGLSKVVLRVLGNTPRVVVGPIPKRVKKGQKRLRKSK